MSHLHCAVFWSLLGTQFPLNGQVMLAQGSVTPQNYLFRNFEFRRKHATSAIKAGNHATNAEHRKTCNQRPALEHMQSVPISTGTHSTNTKY